MSETMNERVERDPLGPFPLPGIGLDDDSANARFDALYAEAKDSLGFTANGARSIAQRYREAYLATLTRWHELGDSLVDFERRVSAKTAATAGSAASATSDAEVAACFSAAAQIRNEVERLSEQLGRHQVELSKLELIVRHLENAWIFLERGDASLVGDESATGGGAGNATLGTDIQMRVLQAQERERARIAQEVHDGPAQGLANAIFQVEYIERLLEKDPSAAPGELRVLREALRRELSDMRSFISQLRPPLLDELGLGGALEELIESMRSVMGIPIEADLQAPPEVLDSAAATVVLRIAQEALHNVRKHASASGVRVSTNLEPEAWVLEVRDDGRGFDVEAVAVRGRRNFGLLFMRERAELIGARLEVMSRTGAGTVVRLAVPRVEER